MLFQVVEIVLWPKDTSFSPRRVEFHLGKVNVISGASKSGKTAVIPIIDYCLGSQRCSIPVGTIRECCSWFGVIVKTDEGKKLFARKAPGKRQQSGDMYILEDGIENIPNTIVRKNATADEVKMILNRLACLTSLDFSSEVVGGYNSRPSFRDLVAFTFQPQNIVANPDVLFFKADTTKHREKLKTIFPYVLGAITLQMLEDKKRLEKLNRELRRKEGELKLLEVGMERLLSELQTWFTSACGLGLIGSDYPCPEKYEDFIKLFSRVVMADSKQVTVTPKALSRYVKDIEKLDSHEAQLSTELLQLRGRFRQLVELRTAAKEYHAALAVQRERLSLSEWLLKRSEIEAQEGETCLFMEQGDQLRSLCDSLSSIEKKILLCSENSNVHGAEYQELSELIEQKTSNLKSVQRMRRKLEDSSADIKRQTTFQIKVERFLGALENALETYRRATISTSHKKKLEELKKKIEKLERKIQLRNSEKLLKNALGLVEDKAAAILPDLDSEWPSTPFTLDVKDLTVRVLHQDRVDALWEIGSGANWLAYHVAITLGLQQFFMDHNNSIPNLLIYDQPSQVYFPRRLARDSEVDEPSFSDEDILAVRKIFTALGNAVKSADGKLQVIVLDHADKQVWGGLSEVKLVEEWRGRDRLIPEKWLPVERNSLDN
jgi:hypothetical protein